MTTTRLQAALPREMYVDDAALGDRARRGALRRVVLRRPGRRPRPGTCRRGCVTVDVVGESVLVTSDEHGRPARGVQRLPAPRLAGPLDRRRRGPRRLRGVGAALPVPLLDLRPRRSAAQGAARRPRGRRAPDFALHPVGVETWGGFVFVHLTPEHADAARRRGGARRRPRWPTTASAAWSPGTLSYDVAANYKVLLENYNECYHCGPVHPEL